MVNIGSNINQYSSLTVNKANHIVDYGGWENYKGLGDYRRLLGTICS